MTLCDDCFWWLYLMIVFNHPVRWPCEGRCCSCCFLLLVWLLLLLQRLLSTVCVNSLWCLIFSYYFPTLCVCIHSRLCPLCICVNSACVHPACLCCLCWPCWLVSLRPLSVFRRFLCPLCLCALFVFMWTRCVCGHSVFLHPLWLSAHSMSLWNLTNQQRKNFSSRIARHGGNRLCFFFG